MTGQELSYTVLIYEDHLGTWVKVPGIDMQCLTDDWETGLDLLEEHLDHQLKVRRKKGELVPERLSRVIKHVDQAGYGLTQVEIEERRHLDELAKSKNLSQNPVQPLVFKAFGGVLR